MLPNPTDRSPLRFAEQVKRHFVFLEVRGFRCVLSETTLVRYESSRLAINIYHGRQSYEINLEIERPRITHAYTFGDILRLVGDGGMPYQVYATNTSKGVAQGVSQLAKRFRTCIDTGILDESDLFKRLKLKQDEWLRNYALDIQLEHARTQSSDAWTKKDFVQVVKILSPLQEHLAPRETRRLQYAKKRIL